MVERGEWRRSYRGVFIDNRAPVTPLQPVIAASFAVGGLASHRLALWLWGLTTRRTPEALEFSVPNRRTVRLPDIRAYRITDMPAACRKGAAPGARRRDFRKQNRIVIGNHWILRYDWYDIVEDPDRTAAELVEAYTARTALVFR